MKISPVLPIAFSSLLAASLAAPLRLRYPTPADVEKRADTFLRPKAQSFDELIHEKLDFGSGDPLFVRDTEIEKRAGAETLDQTEDSGSDRSTGTIYSSGGSHQTLAPHGNLDSAIHATLDFGSTSDPLGGSSDPLLFKKDVESAPVEKRAESPRSFDDFIHENLDFGGAKDPLLFKKNAASAGEKRAVSLPASSSSLDTSKNFDSAIHDKLNFGSSSDPLFGTTSVFVRAEKAIEGAVAKVARAFHA